MNTTHIIVVGKPKSGKTSFAKFLGEELGWSVGSTGDYLVDVLSKIIADLDGEPVEQTRKYIESCKEDYRSTLAILGDEICKHCPEALIEATGARIIDGPRRYEEVYSWWEKNTFEDAAKDFNPIFVNVETNRECPKDNFNMSELFRKFRVTTVTNVGSVEDLRSNAEQMAFEIRHNRHPSAERL